MAVVVKLTGDTADLTKKLNDLGVKVEEVGDKTDKAGSKMSGAASALGGMAKVAGGFVLAQGLIAAPAILSSMSDKARDLELQQKKSNIVFGESIGIVDEWAKTNANAMGLTTREATNLAAGLGDLLIPMGFSRDVAAEMATKTLGLSGALAEWSGGTKSAAEVSDILTKAYLGETDGLKALGIAISADEVKQKALSMGLVQGEVDLNKVATATLGVEKATKAHNEAVNKYGPASLQARDAAQSLANANASLESAQAGSTGEVDAQSAALAIQALVFEKSTDAQTAFANGAGSAARKQAEMTAEVNQAKEDLSLALAPAIAFVTTKLAELVPVIIAGGKAFIEDMKPKVKDFIEFIMPVLIALGAMVAEQFAKFKAYYESDIKPALENIQTGAKAVIDFIVEHWPEIETVIRPVMEAVQTLIETSVKIVMGVLGILIDLIGGDFSGAWTRLKQLVQDVWDGIRSIVGDAIELIKALAPLMLEAGEKLGGALMDGLKKALGAVEGFAGNVASAVLDAVKKVINEFVINPINRTLQFSFDTHIPGVGTIDIDPPDIHPLARGTGNFRGGLALVGEEGPELVQLPGGARVFPAGQTASMMSSGGGGGSGTSGSAAGNGAPPKSSGPAPGTEGSGFGYIPDGKGGWQLVKFPLADGQPYWFIDKNGKWQLEVWNSEGSGGEIIQTVFDRDPNSAGSGTPGGESGATPKAGGPGGVGGSAPVGNRGPAGAGTSAPVGASDYEKQILALAIDTNIRTVQVSDRLGMMVDLAKAQNGILNEIMAVLKAPTKIDFTKDGLVWLRDQLGLATGRQWGTA